MFSARRLLILVLALVGLATIASCANWEVQGRRVQRVRAELSRQFYIGMSVVEAEKVMDATYPEHTAYSTEDCDRYSHSVPGYRFRGGPCIFGIVRVGTTWWGYESAVEFRLIFEGDARLGQLVEWPVYTFL